MDKENPIRDPDKAKFEEKISHFNTWEVFELNMAYYRRQAIREVFGD